jgi:serine protease AprX
MKYTAIVCFALLLTFVSAEIFVDKINSKVYEDFLQKKSSAFTIVLRSYVDFSTIKSSSLKEKRIQLHQALVKNAEITQASLKQFLDQAQAKYTSLWINNAIYVEESSVNTMELVKKIASRSDVLEIVSSRSEDLHFETAQGEISPISKSANPNVEWNLIISKAPFIWKNGAEGEGVTVANIDTGVFFNHPGLIKQYRGDANNHDFAWWDGVRSGSANSCPTASKIPCDDHGHGTHTIGTQVGATATDIVGIAPKAKWIACRGFRSGYLVAGAVEGCMQFFFAPTKQDGSGADPSLAPDVIGHSYGVPDSTALERAFKAVEEAGVINVASAGNSRSCRTIARVPGIYKKSFTVGALGYQSARIASFSSKGPGTRPDAPQKPEIAAAGERVNSWSHRGGKTPMSGTSMSGPLVAGAVAALWSKFDDFKNKIEETIKIFERGIDPIDNQECGSSRPHPNYVYGYGNLNVEKAYLKMEAASKNKSQSK